MSMMNSIAAMGTAMSSAKIATEYSTAMVKKVMDTQELAGQELQRMLPDQNALGQYIDTYA